MKSMRRFMFVGTLLLLVAMTTAQPVAAAANVTTSTEYSGLDGESQAVTTTVTLSPKDAKMVSVDIYIQPAQKSFVEYDSLKRSINPGTSDANVKYLGDGHYRIDELETNEKVTITFNAYPKTIKQQSLDIAQTRVEYTQNGQNLSKSVTATADLSSSSYFAYQRCQDQIAELKGKANTQDLWGLVGKGLVGLLILGALLYGVWLIYL